MKKYIFCATVFIGVIVNINCDRIEDKNDSPIIGVVTEEIKWNLDALWPGVYESYIAASYVKFVEGGGARAVPIWYH